MIVLIVGPDNRSARLATQDAIRAADPGGLNTNLLDGKTVSLEAAIAAVSSPGFFGSTRVVVIEDLMTRLAKGANKSGDEDDDLAAAAGSFDLGRLFAATPAENTLILVDRALASVPAGVKRTAPKEARTIACEAPRGPALREWIKAQALAAGGEISNGVASDLASRLYPQTWNTKPANPLYDRPPDLDTIANAIEVLVAAAHPGPIEARHVHEMVAEAREDRLFPFTDALFASEPAAAARELDVLRERGEEPGRISVQIAQQAELLVVYQTAPRGIDPGEIGRELGLSNPQRMHAVARTAGRTRRSGASWLEDAVEADRAVKRGLLRQPWDPLYALLVGSVKRSRR